MTQDPKESPTFELRVNGVAVKGSLRRKAHDPEDYDVVVCDAAIGAFAINDEFAIDTKRHAGTVPIWSRVSLKQLKSELLIKVGDDLPSVSDILESELFDQLTSDEDQDKNYKRSQVALVAVHARRAQRILYQAGIPSILLSLTPLRMRHSEGALAVPNLVAARRELLSHGFQVGPLKYLLTDKRTGKILRIVQRWIPVKKENDDPRA